MLDRRTFVLGAAATAVVATATPAHAAGTPTKSAGVVLVRGTPHMLALVDGLWSLVDESGSVRITTGLENAELVGVADGLTAVGSLRGDPVATLWESTDGIAWREARRLHGVRSEFTVVGGGLALGSVLKHERAPQVRIAARKTQSGWSTVPVRGLEWTDELVASALAATSTGWVAAAVDIAGTVLHTSRDGVTWSALPRLDGVAVRGLGEVRGAVHWVGNEMAGSAPLAGVVGGGRHVPSVPADAKALGITGARSAWLAAGRLITTESR